MAPKKTISIILITAIAIFSWGGILTAPKKTQAMTVFDPSNFTKNSISAIKNTLMAGATQTTASIALWDKLHQQLTEIKNISVKLLLDQILVMITNDIIEWIQNDGEPRFITDFGEFLGEAVDKTGGQLLEQSDLSFLCDDTLQRLVRNTWRPQVRYLTKFEEDVDCTLTEAGKNLEEVFTWEGWLEKLEPQNNHWGVRIIAQDYLDSREAANLEIAKMEAADGIKPVKDETGKITMPSGAVGSLIGAIATQDINKLTAQSADLTDSLGISSPYLVGIVDALISRLIKEGFSALSSLGPSSSQPDAPMPPAADVPTQVTQNYAFWAPHDRTNTESLLQSQKLFQENLTNEFLVQQQTSLDVLTSIENYQKDILNGLKNIYLAKGAKTKPSYGFFHQCALPDWAVTALQGDIVTMTTTSQAGEIQFDKKTKATLRLTAAITPESHQAQAAIDLTRQKINDLDSAVLATETFFDLVKKFMDIASEENKDQALAARDLAIEYGRRPIDSIATTLIQLEADTETANSKALLDGFVLQEARGYAEIPAADQPETLWVQAHIFNGQLTAVNATLNFCQKEDED